MCPCGPVQRIGHWSCSLLRRGWEMGWIRTPLSFTLLPLHATLNVSLFLWLPGRGSSKRQGQRVGPMGASYRPPQPDSTFPSDSEECLTCGLRTYYSVQTSLQPPWLSGPPNPDSESSGVLDLGPFLSSLSPRTSELLLLLKFHVLSTKYAT